MSEKDQHIENFFRKRLGGKEFPFREEDWNALEARLDAMPTAGVGGSSWSVMKLTAVGIVLVVGSFLAGWFVKDYFADKSEVATVAGSRTDDGGAAAADSEGRLTDKAAPKSEVLAEVVEESEGELAPLADSQTTQPGFIKPLVRADNRNAAVPPKPAGPAGGEATGLVELADAPAGSGAKPEKVTAFGVDGAERKAPAIDWLLGAPEPSVDGPAIVRISAPPQAADPTPFRRLAVGISASPDLSSVGLHPGFKEIGKVYGLLFEYRFSSSWKVSTGVFKADKVYTARQGDYNPPFYGGWPGGVEPVKTDAACNVMDIPLTLSYSMLGGKRTALWLNAGISSYWMLSESYHYSYDSAPASSPSGWYGKNKNTHPFSVASVSLSFEAFATPQFSVQLEPFLKIPLAGVGYGKVNLYTAGTLVTAKYHFSKH